MKIYGNKIAQLRNKKGYTREYLAKMAKCSSSYIWQVENTTMNRTNLNKLSSVANVLNVPLREICDYEGTQPDLPKEPLELNRQEDIDFVQDYLNLTPTGKKIVRNLVTAWRKEQQPADATNSPAST
jgi:transcriptional regulator with XRE-family HTH domain